MLFKCFLREYKVTTNYYSWKKQQELINSVNSEFYKQFSVYLEVLKYTLDLTIYGAHQAIDFISLPSFKVMIRKLTHVEVL